MPHSLLSPLHRFSKNEKQRRNTPFSDDKKEKPALPLHSLLHAVLGKRADNIGFLRTANSTCLKVVSINSAVWQRGCLRGSGAQVTGLVNILGAISAPGCSASSTFCSSPKSSDNCCASLWVALPLSSQRPNKRRAGKNPHGVKAEAVTPVPSLLKRHTALAGDLQVQAKNLLHWHNPLLTTG